MDDFRIQIDDILSAHTPLNKAIILEKFRGMTSDIFVFESSRRTHKKVTMDVK